MAILGGSRTWLGPILGAVIYHTISTMLTLVVGNEYTNIAFSLFLMVIVLLLPNGLIGLIAARVCAAAIR